MDVYLGIVVRAAPMREGGELVKVDWDAKSVRARRPILPENPTLDHDPNPRGNGRGCRGIALLDDGVVAATYHTLKVFDADLVPGPDISHGLMVGLHELHRLDDGTIWAAATTVDAALRFHLETRELIESHWPREFAPFQTELGLVPADFDKTKDLRSDLVGLDLKADPSHTHLNAICTWGGDVYALLNRFGAVVNLSSRRVVLRDENLEGAHNLVILDDGTMLVNATRGEAVRFYDIHSGELEKEVRLGDFRWVRRLRRRLKLDGGSGGLLRRAKPAVDTVAQALFVRGLDIVDDLVFVSFSPASVLCFHRHTGKFVDAFNLSEDIRVCVHGLKVRA